MESVKSTVSFLHRTVTVEPVFFFYMLGSYLQYLALQQLLYLKLCMIDFNSTDICSNLSANADAEDHVQKSASYWLIILNLALALPSALSTLVLGSWSDKVGRRIVMVLPALGAVLNGVCLIISAVYIDLSVGIMVLGSVVMGILGSYPTITSAVFSYLGDITKEKTKTKRFGFLEAMTFSGSFVGLLTCGIVIDHLGYPAAFTYYILCNVIAILYILLWLRESSDLVVSETQPMNRADGDALRASGTEKSLQLDDDDDHMSCKKSCLQLFHLKNLSSSFVTIGRDRPNRQKMQLILLLCCLFTFQLVGTGESDTTVLYLKKVPLEFTASQVSYYSGLKSGLQTLTLFLAMPLLHMVGAHDCIIAVTALIFRMSGYVLLGISHQLLQIFVVPVLLAPSGIPAATTRAMMSKIVGPSEQGSMFAVSAALETVTGVLASLIFNSLYPAMLHIMDGGLVFILMAIMLVLPVVLFIVIWRVRKVTVAYVEQQEDELADEMVEIHGGQLKIDDGSII